MGRIAFLVVPMIIAAIMGCGILMTPRLRNSALGVLACFCLLFSIILFSPIAIATEVNYCPEDIKNFLSLLFFVALIAIPPTVYYYVFELSIKEKEERLNVINLYFLPICLLVINSIAFVLLTKEQDNAEAFYFKVVEDVMNYSNFIVILFLFPLMNIFYIYKSFERYQINKKRVAETYSYEDEVNLKWVKTFILGYVLFLVSVYFLQMSTLTSLHVVIGVFMLIYLAFIGYKGYQQVIFNQEALEDLKEDVKVDIKKIKPVEQQQAAPLREQPIKRINNEDDSEKSSIGEEELISDEVRLKLRGDLLQFMETKKPFLNQKLTINQLAKSIKTNSKYLSYLLNNDFDQNFVSFINTYRVEEAKIYLHSSEYDHLKIEVIGNMSGFRSKSSFNNAFKSIASETPSAYRKQKNQ